MLVTVLSLPISVLRSASPSGEAPARCPGHHGRFASGNRILLAMRELPEDAAGPLREYYRHFAEVEAGPVSPLYTQWASGAAEDDAVMERLLRLPVSKRQANLFFGAARIHGVPMLPWAEAREHILPRWEEVAETMLTRRTQTNEAGRTAVLNLAFARIAEETGRPLALIEVGASAGLCLYPDAWPVRYTGLRAQAGEPVRPADAASPGDGDETGRREGSMLYPDGLTAGVQLKCELRGVTPPARLPKVAWRAGIDVNPLDLTDEADRQWLRALIWPGMEHRLERLDAGAHLLAADPPQLVRGDLNEKLPEVLAAVPEGAVPVVFHSAVLVYVSQQERRRFREHVRETGARWVSNEGFNVIPEVSAKLPGEDPDRSGFILALDGDPLARTGPHGQYLEALTGWAPDR